VRALMRLTTQAQRRRRDGAAAAQAADVTARSRSLQRIVSLCGGLYGAHA
jgi:hypothetical protein